MHSVLDSRQLQAFVQLSRTGSFTSAANGLFLTPSAVSHALKELEQRVGCRLVDRRRKKVLLTQAGEQLLQHAEKILGEMTAACTALEHLGKWGKDRLRIGTSAAFGQYILPAVLEEFYRQFPSGRIIVELADTLEMVELVRANRIDLAITLEPKNERELEFRPLFDDELAFVVSPSHPWARTRLAVRDQIATQPYILYKRDSATFRAIEEFFRGQQIVLNSVIELGNTEAIKELVKRSIGISILASWVIARDVQEKFIVSLPLGARKLKRTWGILCWQGRRLTWAEETFLSHCRSVTQGFSG